ncbi:glycosyltransferase family 2 protein [Pelagibius sp. Alg239-R121]|uniref:glycosyltransferase family 2 protein n=1 Tax=Pelagibius sp. Alg239-R121 TaxID=2993448 RepID=UPI0024A6C370|nr:glycosyltransferase family A protein [Pelagibius sp. Alg239-R121]
MISVVIATRNRAPQLEKCLRRFQALDLAGITAWELIVVDNGSSDDTAQVVQKLKDETDLPLQYKLEPTPGVSPARNAGIRSAKYDILAFTDDDCMVDPSWLSKIRQAFHEEPELALVGGRVELYDPEDYEISVRRFDDLYNINTLDDLFSRLIGCNMAISAAAIRKVGLFDVSMGAGAAFKAGEDHEYFYRILKSGGKVVYDPRIRIEHAHGRRAEAEIQKLKSCYVEGRAALFAKHIRAGDRRLIKQAYWELRALLTKRTRDDGSIVAPDYRFFRIYTFHLLRGLLVLR